MSRFAFETHAGATVLEAGRTRFRIWAPALDELTLEIEGRPHAMRQAGQGWFETEAACGAGARYAYRLGQQMVVPDPAARAQERDVDGPSLVVDPRAYRWKHADWRGRAWEECVICEVHPGLAGGFAGVAALLAEMAALGVTAVELMPVGDFAGARNWGYDGVLPYAPDAAYGTPEALKALVDEAHGLGMMVFLDVVYNHFGPAGNYLSAYAAPFFDSGDPTPWGPAIDFKRPEVRRFFTENALMWVEEYRIDGLRLDAVHAISDPGWLTEMAAAVRAASAGRHVHLVLENERNAAHLLGGPPRFDAQWNDDFHNVLHVLLTGECDGYYKDFADEPAARLARCLAEGFIYQGEGSPNHDGRPRGEPSAGLPPTSFVSFLQNHDQIGNRAFGERLSVLAEPAALRAATALLLLAPQIPLMFAGDALGARTPFLFFTDFHGELADAVREGRRREFAKFPAFQDPARRAAIPDPNAVSTYEASRAAANEDSAAWRDFYAMLLEHRRALIVPGLAGARALGARVLGPKAVRAAWRLRGGRTLTIALNLDAAEVPLQAPPPFAPFCAVGADGWESGLALPPRAFLAWIEPA